MVILGFLVMMMIILAGLLYLYYRQLDLQKKAKPFEPPPIIEPPSIADLHGDCLSNPLQCGIDEVKTTIEDGDIPLYEDIYGFKTNLFNMEKALKEDGTCVDDNCPEIQDLVKRVQDISHDALIDSIDHCKERLPTDRLRRIVYNSVGDEVAREPTFMLGYRNEFIDFAEKDLRDIQTYTSVEEKDIWDALTADWGWRLQTDKFLESMNKAYKEDFLNAFGPSLEVGKAGGVTKCDYFVKECADEDPICHEDAVRKHKIIRKYRPEIVDIQSEDFNTRLKESGLVVTPNGIQISVTNQQVMEGATDEEKEKIKAAFAEAQKVSEWWAVDKDGDTFTNDTEYAAYLGSPQTFSRPDSISLFGGYDADNDSKISRGEYFNFIENMDCNVETGEVLCTPKPIET
jgi:hypothetical protein